jgi:hypothetical protein
VLSRGTRQALSSLMGFIADLEAAVADADRQVISPPYLFIQIRQFHFLPARTLLG